ncbi:hypothetical protein chiPu_0011709 [Chiloscyllium punctatum]|uniref:Uncharacterized protein n=1 Tax=Chiloscyllium punctatum TaxID=137246 RepID=A0A401SS77_CHIPU|nr:hypothetical protein [Chiloscyllium punctatum]
MHCRLVRRYVSCGGREISGWIVGTIQTPQSLVSSQSNGMLQLTNFYGDRLKQVIEEGVDGVSSLLTCERIFSGKEQSVLIQFMIWIPSKVYLKYPVT